MLPLLTASPPPPVVSLSLSLSGRQRAFHFDKDRSLGVEVRLVRDTSSTDLLQRNHKVWTAWTLTVWSVCQVSVALKLTNLKDKNLEGYISVPAEASSGLWDYITEVKQVEHNLINWSLISYVRNYV